MTAREPSLFWIDPAQLTQLVERVDRAPVQGDVTLPLPPLVETPPSSPDAAVAELPVIELETAALPPSIEARLEALLSWLTRLVACEQAFVTDREGLALADDQAADELVAAAAGLGQSWDSLRGPLGLPGEVALAVDLTDRRRLHVFTDRTTWGSLYLGFVTRSHLPRITLDQVGDTFREIFRQDSKPEADSQA